MSFVLKGGKAQINFSRQSMKVGLPLRSAFDSPGGNGFRMGSGGRAGHFIDARREVKFETAFGANCLGSRKVTLKSHKEPQTKVSRWKAPKESRINVRRGGQSTFANERHTTTTTTTTVTATTRSSGSRQNAFGRSWFQLEYPVPIVDAVERSSNSRKMRALDESRRFVIASRGIDGKCVSSPRLYCNTYCMQKISNNKRRSGWHLRESALSDIK